MSIPKITSEISKTPRRCTLDGTSNNLNDLQEAKNITVSEQYKPDNESFTLSNNHSIQLIDFNKNSLENCSSVVISNNPNLCSIILHSQCLSEAGRFTLNC